MLACLMYSFMWLVSFGFVLHCHEGFQQELDAGWRACRLIQVPTRGTSSALGMAQMAAGIALLGILEQPIHGYQGDMNLADPNASIMWVDCILLFACQSTA